jgi:small subunit ribosomal protein S7e
VTHPPTANMSNYTKIAANSPSRSSPSEIEIAINNALEDLQNNIPDLKSSLRPLQFVSAREVR